MSTPPQSLSPKSAPTAQQVDDKKSCARLDCLCAARNDSPYCGDYCASASDETHSHFGCLCADEPCMKECDLIMKGGITSGIVYPPLVIKLARKYRFRSIGGTSAGAIAAAITAAAEYGRQKRGESGEQAFKRLAEVKDWLSKDTNLRDLFQPAPTTRPLLNLFLNITASKPKGRTTKIRSALSNLRKDLRKTDRETPLYGLRKWRKKGLMIGLGLALLLSALSFLTLLLLASVGIGSTPSWIGFPLLFLVFGLLFALPLGLVGGLFGGLFQVVTTEVKKNLFGICDGKSQESTTILPLTTWLHRAINYLAATDSDGQSSQFADALEARTFDGPPLTFKELWGTQDPEAEKKIDLRMVASNLSQSQPYILPFEDSNLFLFKEKDFARLFTEEIIRQMRGVGEKDGYTAPSGFHFLPKAADFPVVVATRMSLSFPVLLSAVPLHTIKYGASRKLTKDDLQQNWFSDGGICSNFPIHFFDAWLPSRPTFGVNLTSLTKNQMEDEKVGEQVEGQKGGQQKASASQEDVSKEKARRQEVKDDSYSVSSSDSTLEAGGKGKVMNRAVFLPPPDKELPPIWVDIPNLPRFMGEIFRIAQNYRDNMQAMLPSYRERIVQIALSDKEGGLNLEMPPKVITEVVDKGEIAGEKLLEYFRFDQHQWVRFRVLMREMEKSLAALQKVMTSQPLGFDSGALLDRQFKDKFPFHCDEEWVAEVLKRLKGVNDLMKCWEEPRRLFAKEPNPLPEPVLRVGPQL